MSGVRVASSIFASLWQPKHGLARIRAPGEEFYIVRGPDRKCVVVDVLPGSTDRKNRKERLSHPQEAQADIAVVCKPM